MMINGGIELSVDSDLSGRTPQFTLTCISTGGPATTVTWTRDSGVVTKGNVTLLLNTSTAEYAHTLTVAGRLGGLYTCTVANDKPSMESANLSIQGIYIHRKQLRSVTMSFFPVASAPISVMAVQEGPTSIRVSWSPPIPLGDTTGYRIYYSGGSSGSVDIIGSSTDNYILTSLQSGSTYVITIVGTSQHVRSNAVTNEILLGKSYVNYANRYLLTNSNVYLSLKYRQTKCHSKLHNYFLCSYLLEYLQWFRGSEV